jgi:hypothetical protein
MNFAMAICGGVLDIGTCWTCNFHYVVKVGESVIMRNMRLRNRQRGSIYVSNGFASKNVFVVLSYSFSVSPFSHLGIVSHC